MPLIVETLVQDIIAANNAARNSDDIMSSSELYANMLANAIDKYIKTSTVIVTTSTGPGTGQIT